MEWLPSPGVNCLIGPGDEGKTSVLDAIALLLAPYGFESANELDYRERNIERGFRIEAVLTGVRDDPLIQQRQLLPLRGWKDGELMPLPDENDAEVALVCELRGDENLDLTYSILPLDDDPVPFGQSLRRELALARISAADRANRDLRLGKNSLLARYFKGPGFGGTLTDAVRNASDDIELPEEVVDKLNSLKETFGDSGLPADLQFGMLPAIGWSLTGMVALSTGASPSSAIPIANAGSGTRNLSLLELSAEMSAEHPIVVVDEPERGLEPYRQRRIAARLSEIIGIHGQAFVTTHAPALLSALKDQAIWHVATSGSAKLVDAEPLARVVEEQPGAFFARVPIVCEGPTEQGLLSEWLPPLVGGDLASIGVELVNGKGQPDALTKLEALADAAIPCAAFVDNEAEHSGRRTELSHRMPFFQWDTDKDIEAVLARHLSTDELVALVDFAAHYNGIAAANYYAQLRDALRETHENIDGLILADLIAQCGEDECRITLGQVMSKKSWFKSAEKGQALAVHLNQTGVPAEIRRQVDAFVASLRERFAL